MAKNKMAFNPLSGFDLVRTDELTTGAFAAANNVTVSANVTGLDVSSFEGARIEIKANLDATADLFKKYTLEVYSTGSDYVIVQTQVGPNTLNIDFTVTTGGQIQYTNNNYAGFVTLDYKWTILSIE